MGLLDGKKVLIFGLANDKSIAYGISKAFVDQGAELGVFYANEMIGKRAAPIAKQLNATICEQCDLSSDEEIANAVELTKEKFGQVDVIVHSVAYAPREALETRYVDTERDAFNTTMDISVYTLVGLVKGFEPLMAEGSNIITMTYYGAEKVVPKYNVMGVAKAALECSVRYLACDLGEKGIRINAISAGPIKTLAASGISGFKDIVGAFKDFAPLRRMVTIEEVGDTAVFLASDLARSVTGEVMYVDAGFNVVGCAVKYGD